MDRHDSTYGLQVQQVNPSFINDHLLVDMNIFQTGLMYWIPLRIVPDTYGQTDHACSLILFLSLQIPRATWYSQITLFLAELFHFTTIISMGC